MLHLLAFMEIPMCCLDLVEFLGFYFAGFFLFREVKAWRLVRTQSDGIGWWDARMLSWLLQVGFRALATWRNSPFSSMEGRSHLKSDVRTVATSQGSPSVLVRVGRWLFMVPLRGKQDCIYCYCQCYYHHNHHYYWQLLFYLDIIGRLLYPGVCCLRQPLETGFTVVKLTQRSHEPDSTPKSSSIILSFSSTSYQLFQLRSRFISYENGKTAVSVRHAVPVRSEDVGGLCIHTFWDHPSVSWQTLVQDSGCAESHEQICSRLLPECWPLMRCLQEVPLRVHVGGAAGCRWAGWFSDMLALAEPVKIGRMFSTRTRQEQTWKKYRPLTVANVSIYMLRLARSACKAMKKDL